MFGPQQTIASEIVISGTGAHTGEPVRMKLLPAPDNTGVVFRRVDLPGSPEIPCNWRNVSETTLSTSLKVGEASVKTVEHVLSALAGLRVDNLLIEINSPELPLTDGSSLPFTQKLLAAGLVAQRELRQVLVVRNVVEHHEGDAWVRISPDTCTRFSMTLRYDAPLMQQHAKVVSVEINPQRYQAEIAAARTYSYFDTESGIDEMKAKGFGLGCNLDNALVVCGEELMNSEGFRLPNEFTRHKILDAVGDMCLMGHYFLGHVEGFKSGHAKNAALVKKLMQAPEAWELATGPATLDAGSGLQVAYAG